MYKKDVETKLGIEFYSLVKMILRHAPDYQIDLKNEDKENR